MEKALITKAAGILREGGVIIFPTDTVWGMGASLESKVGIKKLYKLKKRDFNKPTAVLVNNISMAQRYGIFQNRARELAGKYWPGGLTIVVIAKVENVSKLVLGDRKTIGLRVPDHEIALSLLDALDGGIVASSANVSSDTTPKLFKEISEELLRKVDFVVVSEDVIKDEHLQSAGARESSTVVDATNGSLRIIRQGSVRLA